MLNNTNIPDFKQLGQKLTNNSKEALSQSAKLAKKFGYSEILHIHLLYAVFLKEGSLGGNILADLGLSDQLFQKILKDGSPKIKKMEVFISPALEKIIIKSFSAAREFGCPYVGTEHLVYSLIGSEDALIRKILSSLDPQAKKDVRQSLKSLMEPDILSNISRMFNLP
ncbi:MAG TPA: hypothetical protein DIT25_02770, partial [Candidatus Moranbacteria bacterium]|nr:hypothetical protein [Candidatus Moranbacteria bacterium]